MACTCTYHVMYKSENWALQVFMEPSSMQGSVGQMDRSSLDILVVMKVTLGTASLRMMNCLIQDRMWRSGKMQSEGLWIAWRHRNVEASRNCTKFLDACLCQHLREVKEWHTLRQWSGFLPVMDEEVQKLFTPSELLLYKHALEYTGSMYLYIQWPGM